MKFKYGSIPKHQIHDTKKYLQRLIFYLLLYVDPNESFKFQNVDVNLAFKHVQYQLSGFNKILLEPPELIIVMNYIEAAWEIYNSADFDFQAYRKNILDAGRLIMQVKEGDTDGDHS